MKRRARGEGSVFFDERVQRWKAVAPWPHRLTRSGKTQAEAIRRRDEALAKSGRIRTGKETCGQFFNQWLETRKLTVRPRTFERDAWMVTDLASDLHAKRLAKVSPSDVQSVLNASAAIHKPATTSLLRDVLRQAFDAAVSWDLLPANPVSGTIVPKSGRARVVGLSEAARRELRAKVRGTEWEALFECYVVLGLRRGEALALRWSDVYLDAGTLTVKRGLQRHGGALVLGETKTEAGKRTIELPAQLVRSLKRHRAAQNKRRLKAGAHWYNDDDLVFTTRHGTPLEPRNVIRKIHSLSPGTTIHMLRHTAASYMIQQGMPLPEVARVLGHANPAITLRVYAHVIRERSDETRAHLEAIAKDTGR